MTDKNELIRKMTVGSQKDNKQVVRENMSRKNHRLDQVEVDEKKARNLIIQEYI